MEKNGFTLVELIITIGLLALLGVLIATNMVSMQGKQLEKNYENYQKQVASAACVAMEAKDEIVNEIFYKEYNSGSFIEPITNKTTCINNGKCYAKTEKLITNGFLDGQLQNPATGEAVTKDEAVLVEYVVGEKRCRYYSK